MILELILTIGLVFKLLSEALFISVVRCARKRNKTATDMLLNVNLMIGK